MGELFIFWNLIMTNHQSLANQLMELKKLFVKDQALLFHFKLAHIKEKNQNLLTDSKLKISNILIPHI